MVGLSNSGILQLGGGSNATALPARPSDRRGHASGKGAWLGGGGGADEATHQSGVRNIDLVAADEDQERRDHVLRQGDQEKRDRLPAITAMVPASGPSTVPRSAWR